ncbi:MAG: secretion protein HlyD [Pseudomonadales bacterium]
MKRRVVAALVLVAAATAALVWQHPWSDDHQDDGLALYGNVDMREVQLGFRVAGRLASMHLEEGDAVTPGALLATLDDQPYREAVAAATAAVDQAEAYLARLLAGSRPQEIEAARAAVSEAQAALTNSESEYARQQQLISQGASSQQLLDAARARRDQAAARVAGARESLALAVEGPRSEDITAARAAQASAAARLSQAETQLDDTLLRAPARGEIAVRIREPGAMLGVGEPVYVVTLNDRVFVRAYVSEPDLGRTAPGTEVTISRDGGERTYHGQIGFVSPRAEFTPKSVETPDLRTDLVYRLRIVVTDADHALRQGMPVTVTLGAAPSGR